MKDDRQLAQDTLDASAGSFLLPGVMHRLRNLLFKATCKLQLLEVPGEQPTTAGTGLAGEAQLALDEMRGLMDLLEAGTGMQTAPLWLESGTAALNRVGECLGFPVRARRVGFHLHVEPDLPSLGVSPAHLLRWSAVALRHLLEHVPAGLRGSIVARGSRVAPAGLQLRFSFEPAPGYLRLALPLSPLPADVGALASADEVRLLVAGDPYPNISLQLPLRIAGTASTTALGS
jgi:hypothetical protein